jgi:hypothetical protein
LLCRWPVEQQPQANANQREQRQGIGQPWNIMSQKFKIKKPTTLLPQLRPFEFGILNWRSTSPCSNRRVAGCNSTGGPASVRRFFA